MKSSTMLKEKEKDFEYTSSFNEVIKDVKIKRKRLL